MYGFHGHLLHIDLTSATYTFLEIDRSRLHTPASAASALALIFFTNLLRRAWIALAPENPLIFASAPLVGTPLTTTAKYAVVTKSPLTGFIADSLSSSYFALELKKLGVDALVITGRSPSWMYLAIDGGRVVFREATHLFGKSATETDSLSSCRVQESTVSVWPPLVWPARMASGSRPSAMMVAMRVAAASALSWAPKRLKAIAIRGDTDTAIADSKGVAELALAMRHRSVGTVTSKYRQIGTVANLAVFNRLGSLPTRNFQHSTFAHADKLER